MKKGLAQKKSIFGILLFFLLFSVGLAAIPARLYVGDPYTWREEAINLILFHRLNVEPEIVKMHGEDNQFFVQNPKTGLWFSKYGVMNGLLNAIPLYAELRITKKLPPWDSKDRRLYLGVFYSVLGAIFGLLLYHISLSYVSSPALAFTFVFLSIFSTFLGHYLRATNSEAYQAIFFLAFFERFIFAYRTKFQRITPILWGWFFLLCLCLVKISYLILVPIAAFWILFFSWRIRTEDRFRFFMIGALLPALTLLMVQGMVNLHKFGSPFSSGYWWKKDDFSHSIPSWRVLANLLFLEQWGIPQHYPLVFAALFGWRRFFKKFTGDFVLAFLCLFVAVFMIGSMPMWKGEWSYGPRYFLFALPVFCLPSLFLLEAICFKRFWLKPFQLLYGIFIFFLLGGSCWLQFQVERLDPFFSYWVRPVGMEEKKNPELVRFWNSIHSARVAAEAWWKRDNIETISWVRLAKEKLPKEEYEKHLQQVASWLKRTNFYWWSPRD